MIMDKRITVESPTMADPTVQPPRQLQGVTTIDGISEEIGFDMDEIYQVLGRDILKSSVLDDIDLYLECDEDSLYVMPTVASSTASSDAIARGSSVSFTHSGPSSAPNRAPMNSGLDFDTNLALGSNPLLCFPKDSQATDTLSFLDTAFPVSTFVNRANPNHLHQGKQSAGSVQQAQDCGSLGAVDIKTKIPNGVTNQVCSFPIGDNTPVPPVESIVLPGTSRIPSGSKETKRPDCARQKTNTPESQVDQVCPDTPAGGPVRNVENIPSLTNSGEKDLSRGSETVIVVTTSETKDPQEDINGTQTHSGSENFTNGRNGMTECDIRRQTFPGVEGEERGGLELPPPVQSANRERNGTQVLSGDTSLVPPVGVSMARAPPVTATVTHYTCPHCTFSCTRETVLHDHRAKIHQEAHLFTCTQCNYEGMLFKHLQKHMKRQHKVALRSVEYKKKSFCSKVTCTRIVAPKTTQSTKDKPENIQGPRKSNCHSLGPRIQLHSGAMKDKLVRLLSSMNETFHLKKAWVGRIKLISLLKRHSGLPPRVGFVSLLKRDHSEVLTSVASNRTTQQRNCHQDVNLVSFPVVGPTLVRSRLGSERPSNPASDQSAPKNDVMMSCDLCSRTFRQKRSLIAHVNQEHRGVRPFACGSCEKSFGCKNLLRQHEKSHVLHKPYQCSVNVDGSCCGKTFRTKSRLEEHKATVHCASADKQFRCEMCGCAFSRERHLRAHLNTHTGSHKCHVCAKTFRDAHNLKRHFSTHSKTRLKSSEILK